MLVVWFQVTPNLNVLALPLLVLIMVLAASGRQACAGIASIQYRDISYALSFIIQMLMYASRWFTRPAASRRSSGCCVVASTRWWGY